MVWLALTSAIYCVCFLPASSRLLHQQASCTAVSELSKLPCKLPVRRAPVNFPPEFFRGTALPLDFKMESGYINVTQTDFLFYWYFSAHHTAAADAPLIVWSNGGPGCSAMEGATTEGGPLWLYNAKQSGKNGFSGKLSRNPFAWNQHAHLIFVDQPRYVGYSTGTGPRILSSANAGKDMVAFLRGWRATFPEHRHRKIILASESYGGHYVPAWANAVLDFNKEVPREESLPFAGALIGNGIVNETVQDTAAQFVAFAKAQNLLPSHSQPSSEAEARDLIRKALGYRPNFYDYRLEGQDTCCGCGGYDYKEWADWFWRTDVREALNVCGDAGEAAFGGCGGGCVELSSFDSDDTFEYSKAVARILEEGIPVTFYYGMQDTACNYHAARHMASTSLDWSGASTFLNATIFPLRVGGAEVGDVQSAVGSSGGVLTFVAVDGAGHMVPMDNGGAATFAIETLLNIHSESFLV